MKKYTFKVVINEASLELWEELEGRTGCDEILEHIKCELVNWTDDVKLVKYEDV